MNTLNNEVKFINVVELDREDYFKAAEKYFANYTEEQLSMLDYEDISVTELRNIIFNYDKKEFYDFKAEADLVHCYALDGDTLSNCYDPFNFIDEEFTTEYEFLYQDCNLYNIEADIFDFLNS